MERKRRTDQVNKMERPRGLGPNPFKGTAVRDRNDMEVDHKDEEGKVYYKDKVTGDTFYMGKRGQRVNA